jgi:phospholipase/lecithinase/hemolysin
MNELSTYHNSMLQGSLSEIRSQHPDVEITYADFFGPVMEMVESPARFGQ